MRLILIIIASALSGCSSVSPSTKIFEVAQGVDKNGNPKAVSVKVFDSQADFLGATKIVTNHVTIEAADGINHSLAVKYHWTGIHDVGAAIAQPLIWGPVTGAVLGDAIGTGAQFIPKP